MGEEKAEEGQKRGFRIPWYVAFLKHLTMPNSRADEEQQARRRYKKDLVHLKPDLATYNKQKELALGLAPGSLKAGSSSSSSALTTFDSRGGAVRLSASICFRAWPDMNCISVDEL